MGLFAGCLLVAAIIGFYARVTAEGDIDAVYLAVIVFMTLYLFGVGS